MQNVTFIRAHSEQLNERQNIAYDADGTYLVSADDAARFRGLGVLMPEAETPPTLEASAAKPKKT